MFEEQTDEIQDGADKPLGRSEMEAIVREAVNQAPWRSNADHEADYADGNQLSSDLLRKMKERGIPPAKENIIGPAIRAVCGYEAKTRTDWRVTPDGDPDGQDVADALNFRLNQAERHSNADRAMSKAFQQAITSGIGWVEVSRAANSLVYPYKCRPVHRNEIWWDMSATEPDLSDARWLYRRRWVERSRAALLFPDNAFWLKDYGGSMNDWIGSHAGAMLEGGTSTGLKAAADAERAWTSVEDRWYNDDNRSVCITEVWYRRWVPVLMLRMNDGRAVQYDEANELHQAALSLKRGRLFEELHPKMRHGYWIGPHCLHDAPTPYPHDDFPYVPFWAYQEDMTRIPYGMVRDMLFPQDNINSTTAKLRWNLASRRTVRTKDAVAMSNDQFRRQIARPDADILLNASHFKDNPGARFEVQTDAEINPQHFQLMQEARASIERIGGVSAAFMGQRGTATSGTQEQTQLEQSQVAIADLMDSFADSRKQVGELLMAMLIEDMGATEQTIIIEGDTISPTRSVVINRPEIDPVTGLRVVSNDIQRARLLVSLEDVPTTSSFRTQQLAALSEAVKALPPELQKVTLPFMINLMDLPHKRELVDAIKAASAQADPEQMRAQVEDEVKQKLMHDLKVREEDRKDRESEARVKQLMAQAVQTGVQAAFSAMQAGAQVAQMPMIAPIADEVMKGAGYQRPTPGGDDPNFPTPEAAAAMQMRNPYIQGEGAQPGSEQLPPPLEVRQNTSPAFPPVPQQADPAMAGGPALPEAMPPPGNGMDGIETPELT